MQQNEREAGVDRRGYGRVGRNVYNVLYILGVNMKTVIFALLTALLLSSCITRGKMTGVREGMTKAQVINVAGNPDGYQRSGEYEVLLYIDRSSTWSLLGGTYRDVLDYSVILRDDHVVEFAPGRSHQRDSAVPFVRIPSR